MEVRKGYKQTDVGVIPEDWEVKKLGEFAHVATGNTPPTNDQTNYGHDYFFVSPADLGRGKYIIDTDKKLSKKGFDISRKFPKSSILFTCIGSTIGKSGIAPIELTSNQQINAIFPHDSFSSDYLLYSLNLLAPRIKSLAGEQAVPIINKAEFEETLIPFPPTKAEQEAIAEVLSDADVLIESLEKLVAKKRDIKQAAMQKLLTGNKRLPGFSGKWETKKLGDVCKLQSGRRPKGGVTEEGDIPSLGGENIEMEGGIKFDSIKKVGYDFFLSMTTGILKDEDVLINKDGANTGKVGLYKGKTFKEACINEHLFIMRGNKLLNNSFLFYFLCLKSSREQVTKQITSSAQPGINSQFINHIEIILPKPDEQTAITKVLSDMDAEIEALEQKRDKYKTVKQGMMQELLTGKTRLI